MALLCLAAQGEPYGSVTIKGAIPSNDQLFDLTAPRGTRRRDWNLWMQELITKKVAQSDHRGAIVSPRMIQTGVTSAHREQAAQQRWETAENSHSSQNLHVQKKTNGAGLHMQEGDFASHRSRRKNQNPSTRDSDSFVPDDAAQKRVVRLQDARASAARPPDEDEAGMLRLRAMAQDFNDHDT